MNAEQISKVLNVSISDTMLNSIPQETREMVLFHAKMVSEITPTWHEAIPKKVLMKAALRRASLYTPDSLLEELIEGRSFEIWDSNMKLVACCWQIFQMTSFSVEEMLTNNWSKLLHRDPENIGRIIVALSEVQASGKVLRNITPPHRVEELKENGSIHEVTLNALSPVYHSETHEFSGYAAVTTLRPLLS